ncbi:MAG: endopeptidase La, partial [Proteobacteria bacterium]|nr:endopeptidase La [Pseudomonadota bacterium]
FKLTGQLGKVMRESAEIAYSFVASHLGDFGADAALFDSAYIHIHVPEGATPKDGPSAGITMASALLSLALGRKIPRPIAMTGELTLTGRVLPIGGVREKIIAAKRNGIKELILPASNQGDFDELPAYIKKGITAHFADTYQDVAAILFGQATNKKK